MGEWTRAKLKEGARKNIKKNYWTCVLVAFLIMIVSGGWGVTINLRDNIDKLFDKKIERPIMDDQYAYQPEQRVQENIIQTTYEYDEDYDDEYYDTEDKGHRDFKDFYDYYLRWIFSEKMMWFLAIMFVGMSIYFVISLVVSACICMPVQVGGCRFFMCNREDHSDLNHLLIGFQGGHYGNVVKIMFLRSIKIFLWSLLFVIPGIIKAYEYAMIPYLLSEDPGINSKTAFSTSKEMTSGEKLNMFLLDFSFFPWMILAGITGGIVGIFWVFPYMQATTAELYSVLREKLRYRNGRILGDNTLQYAYAEGYQNQAMGGYPYQQQMYNNNQNESYGNTVNQESEQSYGNYGNAVNQESGQSYYDNFRDEKTYGSTLDDFDKKNNS